MNTPRFDPRAVAEFRYVARAFDPVSGLVTLDYALDDLALRETFRFPVPSEPLSTARAEVIARLVDHLFLAAGISYYKCAAPPRIRVEAGSFGEDDLVYHRTLLAKGLGEFSFVNGLDPDLSPEYVLASAVRDEPRPPVTGLGLDAGPLVPVGGGKDSCVTVEALRLHDPTLVTVNRYPVMQDVIDASGLPDLLVVRSLDPAMRALNASGALNGHVPITAIVSLACLIAAVLHGHDAVVMSDERSASEGNVVYRGVEINHQWSKGDEAERLLRRVLARITPELEWFSLLRPLSELAIVDRFAETGGRYRAVFSSCNAAFKLDPAARVQRWCGHCPKCQFVWLALSTRLPPAALVEVFGVDVFAASPRSGFLELLGLGQWKPFECVGESSECRVALRLAATNPAWAGHPTVVDLAGALHAAGRWPSDAEIADTYRLRPAEALSQMPARYAPAVPIVPAAGVAPNASVVPAVPLGGDSP